MRTQNDLNRFSDLLRDIHGIVWTPTFSHKQLYKWSLKSINIAKKLNPALTFVFGSTAHFNAFGRFKNRYGLWKPTSTGLYFVSCALSLCKRVNVFGFWPFRTSVDGRDLRYHYHNEIQIQRKHSMDTEFKILIAMHRLGLLKLNVGECR